MTTDRFLGAEDYAAIAASRKKNTQAAIQSDLNRLMAAGYDLLYVTPAELADYLAGAVQGRFGKPLKPTTLVRFLSTLRKFHQNAGILSPADNLVVKQTMQGIQYKEGTAPKQALALEETTLMKLGDYLASRATGSDFDAKLAARDLALISLGFWRGLRADTFTGIKTNDCTWIPLDGRQALQVTLRQEKQNKEGGPRQVVFEASPFLCPIDALQRWLSLARAKGPLFPKFDLRKADPEADYPKQGVHRNDVTRLLRTRLQEIGFKEVGGFSAHSLRHSFGRWAGDKGLPLDVIMSVGDWKSVDSARRYLEESRNRNAFVHAQGHVKSITTVDNAIPHRDKTEYNP